MPKDNILQPREYDVSTNISMDPSLEKSLITAFINNDLQTIQTLITAENVNHYMPHFGGSKTPLQQACERAVHTKDFTIVQYLLDIGASVGTYNESRSPIEVAFHNKNIELGALLYAKDSIAVWHYNEYLTPMSEAMSDQRIDFLHECETELAGEVA